MNGVPWERAPAAARSMPGRSSGSASSIGSMKDMASVVPGANAATWAQRGRNRFARQVHTHTGYAHRRVVCSARWLLPIMHSSLSLAHVRLGVQPLAARCCPTPNSCFTEGRIRTTMVNAPSTVPSGLHTRHAMAAMTMQYV